MTSTDEPRRHPDKTQPGTAQPGTAQPGETQPEAVTTAPRVHLLGAVRADHEDEPVQLGGRRQRAVLAVLALARGHLVPAGRLIDAVWGDDPPGSAAATLQAYVSHLRRALEPNRRARSRSGVIVSDGQAYALRLPEDAVDAWRFEALVARAAGVDPGQAAALLDEALALWQGPALHEYADQWWAQADVRRLSGLQTHAREQLLAARLDLGEAAALVPELETLIDENPLREERWRLLVLALYRSARQADALATLRRARETLVDELGVDPGKGLRDLEAAVLAQSPELDAPARPAPVPAAVATEQHEVTEPVTPPTRSPVSAGATADPLEDREREVAVLEQCLTDLRHGQASFVLIEGPAGLGKTRLLAELRSRAVGEGMTVLSARGSQLEREYGFGVVRQLFEPLLATPGAADGLMSGAAAGALGVFDTTGEVPHPRVEGMFPVLHGLYWLAVNAAAGCALVLTVDDLQWSDSGSMAWLLYLTRRLEGIPVLVAATLRAGERHSSAELVAELTQEPLIVPIHPGPLTAGGVGSLVRARLGEHADEAFVVACHRTTGGNPLLLRQLLRALEAERVRPDASHADTVRAIGSRAVSSLVLMRFARMPVAARTVARAVAVLGDGASLPAVASLSHLSEQEAAAALDGLVRAEVLRDDYPLGFVHPLVGDAVYGDLPPGERELLHERASRVLGAGGATPERIAAHLLIVTPRGDHGVVRLLREAAQREVDRGALQSATAYLRRALEEPPPTEARAELLLDLGRLEASTDGPAALQHLTEAYQTLDDEAQRADAACVLARSLVFAGERGQAAAVARAAREALPEDLDDHRQMLLALERITGFMHDLDPASYDKDAKPEIRGEGPGARSLAATLAWEEVIDVGNRTRAIELAQFSVADGVLQQVDAGLLWVVTGITLEMCGEDTMAFWTQALADAHARGGLFAALGTHLWRGFVEWRRGDLREAYQSFVTTAEQSERWGSAKIGQQYVDAFLVGVLLDQGRVEAARAQLESVREHDRLGDGVRLFGEAESDVLLAEGKPEQALEALARVQDSMTTIRNPVWRPWRCQQAAALAAMGQHEPARTLLDEELALARRWGAPSTIARVLRLRGELGGADGVEDLRESVALLEKEPVLLERARSYLALAQALLAGPEELPAELEEAMAALFAALDLAETCAADGVRRTVAQLLAKQGIIIPDEVRQVVCLTTTERRIASLAVDGVSDREIAEAFFLTPRTISATLGSVKDRLEVSTLDELRTALADL